MLFLGIYSIPNVLMCINIIGFKFSEKIRYINKIIEN